MANDHRFSRFLDPDIAGIDVHVHGGTRDRKPGVPQQGAKQGRTGGTYDFDEFVSDYRQRKMCAIIFDVDRSHVTGVPVSNDAVAGLVEKAPDMLMGFCSVDPWGGRASVNEIRRCAEELHMRGVKFQPVSQAFFPNEQMFYPIYEACQELGLVVVMHSGTTAVGQGSPGGGGYKLKYARPIFLDDIAADFPDLKIVSAHPSWPWHDEALAVARHKPNVYIDLSGWAPRYFPESVVQQANTLLQDKVLFGTDHPMISPSRWLKDFEELPIKDSVRPKIMVHNARRLLGFQATTE